MALALLFEDDSVVILDAVTNYNKNLTSTLSKHPVDKSAVITDHIAKQNPEFTFRAIISSADFHSISTRSPELLEQGNVDDVYNTPVEPATITHNGSLVGGLLPSSIAQILDSPAVTVEMDSFRGYSHVEARNRLQQAWEDSEIITLLDYDYDFSTGRSIDVKNVENCIMLRFEDVEDVDTGDALQANFTFQKARFAYIQEADIEEQPDEDTEDPASPEEDEGDQSEGGALTIEGQLPFYSGSPLEDGLGAVEGLVGDFFGGGE